MEDRRSSFEVTIHNFPLAKLPTFPYYSRSAFPFGVEWVNVHKYFKPLNLLLDMHVSVACDYVGRWKGFIWAVTFTFPHSYIQTMAEEGEKPLKATEAKAEIKPYSRSTFSCWRTSRMSSEPTSRCTWIKSCCSCRSLNRPAGGVCAPSLSSSRPPFVLRGSSSSARVTRSRLSTLCAPAPWKYWRTTPC